MSNPLLNALLLNPFFDLYEVAKECAPVLQLRLRKKLIWAYSWAIPSREVIHAIGSRSSSILEVGAGTGYWAWLLSQTGVNVVARDVEPGQSPTWFPIRNEVSETDLSRDGLLLCWPPFESSMALDALKRFKGNAVYYVGEWRGRTASPAFHDELENWTRTDEVDIPSWPGFSDRLYCFERRS